MQRLHSTSSQRSPVETLGNGRRRLRGSTVAFHSNRPCLTEEGVDRLLRQIVSLLGSDGILSGYTLTEGADGKKGNVLHEYEFRNMEDPRQFFTPHFKFARVWETIYPTRHNLYFAASQSEILPFG